MWSSTSSLGSCNPYIFTEWQVQHKRHCIASKLGINKLSWLKWTSTKHVIVCYGHWQHILLHVGFSYEVMKWIMGCATSVDFAVLINNSASNFSNVERSLWQGYPLWPYLFLLVTMGLSKLLKQAANSRNIKVVLVGKTLSISHMLFVDDILIFYYGMERELRRVLDILDVFNACIGMELNFHKSAIYAHNMCHWLLALIHTFCPFYCKYFEHGLKYLGFHVNSNNYLKVDHLWLVVRIEVCINSWCNHWLLRGVWLVPIKSTVKSTLGYWHMLAYIT